MFNGFRFGTAKNQFQMDGWNGLKKKNISQVVKIWFIIQLQPPFISLQTYKMDG